MDTSCGIAGFKHDCLIFDMDDTLYPLSSGLNFACRKNIEEYMLKRLHMEESEVPKVCLDLYKEYGTTMAGLKAFGYEFDNDEFHAYVHGRLPYGKLKPDPVLRNLLLSMPQRKIVCKCFALVCSVESIPHNSKTRKWPSQVFTNADEAHAHQVLNRLALKECFDSIICFETLNPPNHTNVPTDNRELEWTNSLDEEDSNQVESGCFNSKTQILCKPSVEAIEAAIQIANVDPRKTLFFDDSARNIASGKAAGLNTVIVGRSDLVPGADHALNSIHNIKEALPEIWEVEGDQQQMIQSPAVETMVLA